MSARSHSWSAGLLQRARQDRSGTSFGGGCNAMCCATARAEPYFEPSQNAIAMCWRRTIDVDGVVVVQLLLPFSGYRTSPDLDSAPGYLMSGRAGCL